MRDGFDADSVRKDSSVVWTGRTQTVYGSIYIGVFFGACGLLIAGMELWEPSPSPADRIYSGLAVALFIASSVLIIRWAVLQIRRVFLEIDSTGLLRQDWRGRRQRIPWQAVKSLTYTESSGGASVALRWLNAEGRLCKTRLITGASLIGTKPADVRDLILRHKVFATQRERITWYLSRETIYED